MTPKLRQRIDKAKPTSCDHCGRKDGVMLRRNIAANGVSQFFWYCLNCERQAVKGGLFIGHEVIGYWIASGLLKADSMETIPIVNDYSVKRFCEVCGATGAEYHHFAPQALAEYFGEDWYQWPGAYLCRTHHMLWHSVVTWYMPGPAVGNSFMRARYGGAGVRSD